MKRVLLTGARGFVGRHAAEPLRERGFDVHAVTSRAGAGEPGVTWHRADLLDARQVEPLLAGVRPSHLLHLAWFVEHGRFWDAPVNVAWVAASLQLAGAFLRHGGRRLVIAGTCAEYDWSGGVCDEADTLTVPGTLYGAAKLSVWTALNVLAPRTGLSAATGRLFHLYGPDESPGRLVPAVVRSLLAGRETPCSDGTQVRDFLHVQDAAAGLVALLDSNVTGPVNVASGDAVEVRQVIRTLAGLMDREHLVKFGALPQRAGDPPVLVAHTTRLRDEVGWAPALTLEGGLAATVAWWRAHEPTLL
jgi:nucleoside-diphosphate-sugar epimerase